MRRILVAAGVLLALCARAEMLSKVVALRYDAARSTTPLDRVSTQGKTPRGFAIDPSGRFLIAANQNSGTVVVCRIDQDTGALTPTGVVVQVPSPVSVVFAG